jgi:hypothetical protein
MLGENLYTIISMCNVGTEVSKNLDLDLNDVLVSYFQSCQIIVSALSSNPKINQQIRIVIICNAGTNQSVEEMSPHPPTPPISATLVKAVSFSVRGTGL